MILRSEKNKTTLLIQNRLTNLEVEIFEVGSTPTHKEIAANYAQEIAKVMECAVVDEPMCLRCLYFARVFSQHFGSKELCTSKSAFNNTFDKKEVNNELLVAAAERNLWTSFCDFTPL